MLHVSAVSARKEVAPDLAAIQALFDRGAHRKALYRAKQALRQMPDHAALNALAGSSARQLGFADEAEAFLRKAVALAGEGSAYVRILGDLLLAQDRAEAAVAVFAGRLRHRPDDAVACNGMGLALLATGQFPQALTILSEAARLAPGNAGYVANLGHVFEQAGIEAEARRCFDLACVLAPDVPRYHAARARLEHLTGDAKVALATLEDALARWPHDGDLLDTNATILSALGRAEEAEASCRAAIAAAPDSHVVYANFAAKHSMAGEGGIEASVRRLLDGADGVARMSLLFTLTRIEEDKGDFGAAYAALREANALRRAQLRYDPQADVRIFAALKREFTKADVATTARQVTGPVPIFVTGLPRSGTTLTETILDRHAQVTALGELNTLMHAVRRGWLGAGPGATAEDRAARLRADYLSALPGPALGAGFVTDKMPLNFRFIGHIAAAFPEARIVHVTRDARATCWSIFRQYFSSAGNGFAYDAEDILRYHALYRDLMAFWEARFSGRIVTLDYDRLVADQDGQTRRFLDELGLPWDAACLRPEESRRVVLTASSVQVRRKIYGGSSQGWRRYAPYAGDWLARLDQAP